jgi:hypothetical protein
MMEGSELRAGRGKFIARIRGSLLVLTLILSLMTAGLPVWQQRLTVRVTPRKMRLKPWMATSLMTANGARSPITAGCRLILAL